MIRADDVAGVPDALGELAEAVAAGAAVAGYLTYEAGAAWVPGVPLRDSAAPLLWFGVFEGGGSVDAATLLPDPAGAWIGAVTPDIDRATHAAHCESVLALIAAGDIYQANLTFGAQVPVAGDPLALYAAIRPRAAAGHGAVVWTGSDWLLSFSPELFFAVEGGRITARPMKGTATRDPDPARDRAAAAALAIDPKQRAENLMIVDLMRNDLSRVAMPGSVQVPERFVVETYPSIHQLVSSVTAELLPGTTAVDAIAALFPCGSITGAPKRRAMQAIDAVEGRTRGIYTGAIGAIDAGGDASFNVAIRTLHLPAGASHATLGLGSGVVADLQPHAEWQECIAKARFLDTGPRRFDLVETMAFDPLGGIALLERHLARMTASAHALGFAFDRHATRNELQAATFRLREAARVRLLLSVSGAIAVDVTPLPPPPPDRSRWRSPPARPARRPAAAAQDQRPPLLAGAAAGLFRDDLHRRGRRGDGGQLHLGLRRCRRAVAHAAAGPGAVAGGAARRADRARRGGGDAADDRRSGARILRGERGSRIDSCALGCGCDHRGLRARPPVPSQHRTSHEALRRARPYQSLAHPRHHVEGARAEAAGRRRDRAGRGRTRFRYARFRQGRRDRGDPRGQD
ncbi:aminodeoxychorismate synthase component I [Sphingomonas hankookensis]|uniref:aminodeoxychorismate synthase component I n=1 Tax=Sphingomonas hankookensis TaxID=563996 RepID=UPI003D30355F